MGRKKASFTKASGHSKLVKKFPCKIKKIADSPSKVKIGGRVSTRSKTTATYFGGEVPKQKGPPKPRATASAKLKQPYAKKSSDKILDLSDNNLIENENLGSLSNNNNKKNNVDGKVLKKEKEVTKIHPTDDDARILLPMHCSNNRKTKSSSPSKEGKQYKGAEFKCEICHQCFPTRYFQRKHMFVEHEGPFCGRRVSKLLKRHIKLLVTNKAKLQDELEKFIDKKVPHAVMLEDGVTIGGYVNSNMRYVCALCNRIYTSKYSLECHIRCHTPEKSYHCDMCDYTSSYKSHMMSHITSLHLIVHSNAPKVKYISKKKLNEEGNDLDQNDKPGSSPKKRLKIMRERFECVVCGITATHKTDLMQHIRLKHPNAQIESLENKDGSKGHTIVAIAKKQKQTKRLTIQCTYCSLILHDTWKYKVHLRSHTGVKPFQCSICNFKATTKMTVRDHIHRKHTADENAKILVRAVGIDGCVEEVELPVPQTEFRCEICDSQFNDNYNLKLHKKKSHPEALPFVCMICSHKEMTKGGMIVHCYTNHKDKAINSIITRNGKLCKIGSLKPPTCDLCGKIFTYKCELNKHTRSHTGEKVFNCNLCDYKANKEANFVVHLLSEHTVPMGNKQTGENKTGMKFHCHTNHKGEDMYSIIMKNGKQEIGPVKLYTCNICDKLFPYKYRLDEHTSSHTGERKFNCGACEYKTNVKKTFASHLEKAHKIPMGNNQTQKNKAVVKREKRGSTTKST